MRSLILRQILNDEIYGRRVAIQQIGDEPNHTSAATCMFRNGFNIAASNYPITPRSYVRSITISSRTCRLRPAVIIESEVPPRVKLKS